MSQETFLLIFKLPDHAPQLRVFRDMVAQAPSLDRLKNRLATAGAMGGGGFLAISCWFDRNDITREWQLLDFWASVGNVPPDVTSMLRWIPESKPSSHSHIVDFSEMTQDSFYARYGAFMNTLQLVIDGESPAMPSSQYIKMVDGKLARQSYLDMRDTFGVAQATNQAYPIYRTMTAVGDMWCEMPDSPAVKYKTKTRTSPLFSLPLPIP